MNKPIFYRCKSNDECYKVVMYDDLSEEDINSLLDAIGLKDVDFITEEDFNSKYSKTMDIDIMDTTSSRKIGVLTNKYIDFKRLQDGDIF